MGWVSYMLIVFLLHCCSMAWNGFPAAQNASDHQDSRGRLGDLKPLLINLHHFSTGIGGKHHGFHDWIWEPSIFHLTLKTRKMQVGTPYENTVEVGGFVFPTWCSKWSLFSEKNMQEKHLGPIHLQDKKTMSLCVSFIWRIEIVDIGWCSSQGRCAKQKNARLPRWNHWRADGQSFLAGRGDESSATLSSWANSAKKSGRQIVRAETEKITNFANETQASHTWTPYFKMPETCQRTKEPNTFFILIISLL